jgi:hypothetical protein
LIEIKRAHPAASPGSPQVSVLLGMTGRYEIRYRSRRGKRMKPRRLPNHSLTLFCASPALCALPFAKAQIQTAKIQSNGQLS